MRTRSRDLLDLVGRDTLIRLMRERGLTPTRENDERRKSLAHSYRGDIEELIVALTRRELVEIFREVTFEQGSDEVYLSNPGKYRLDELQAFAIRAFAGRRVRIPEEFTPVEDEEAEDEDEYDSGGEEDEDEDEYDSGEDDDEADEVLPIPVLLRVESTEWSRPRLIARIFRQLGEEEPQHLRTVRFRGLLQTLGDEGIEAALADDPTARVLTSSDESPGIEARLRLRLRAAHGGRTTPGAERADNGGPRIVLESGEKPIPQQISRPSDYNLAVLRLQFLTAVPSVERASLPAWPEGYLLAATRGLSLREQERTLLRAFAAGLCLGNHSPYDAIPRLTQVLSASEWDALLHDFQVLNPFQPELVHAIVAQAAPVIAPQTQRGAWREPPPDLVDREPLAAPQPMAASGRAPVDADTERDETAANQRDLGALAGMFDDE